MIKFIGDSYRKIKSHIAQLAKECERDPEDITLLAVTKTLPMEHILSAYEVGGRHFGENKVQEALEKIQNAPDDIGWHLIGTLQKNKVRKVIGKFSLIHSVDSLELAEKIETCSEEAKEVTKVLLQVNTSGEQSKHGLSIRQWRNRFEEILSLNNISVEGLMTIAPFSDDTKVVRECFRKLRDFREELQELSGNRANIHHLSMGMTNDYPIAIEEGATILRIGSAIFGDRD
ncbi:MAG: YggS family pyridoxal phosphate-dependent enzyme [Chlamydiota bacterium]